MASQMESHMKMPTEEGAASDGASKHGCCSFFRFAGLDMAKGYNWLGIGRGGIVMSNIFLSTSLIYLASQEAGCFDYEEDKVLEDCDTRVYGMLPVALISNVAVISGLLSAFCMPVIGGIVDCTSYRTVVGVLASVLLGIIQSIQIGTVSSTWFFMAILQAFAGFLYQAHVMSVMSFLPNIAWTVGQKTMIGFTSIWQMSQFTGQACFLLMVIVLTGFILRTNAVITAQINQGLNVVWIGIVFTLGWRLFPWKVPINRALPEGKALWTEGFRQNWKTIRGLFCQESKALRYYFLALVFAEAATNTFTTVAPTYLIEALGMGSTEVGIFFLVTLVSSLPGGLWAKFFTSRTNPNLSWRLSMLCLAIVGNLGAFLLDTIEIRWAAYVWGALVGVCLGWFYPTENCFFSMIVPPKQGAELSGFYVYCSQILGWLPPLFFSLMVENGLNQKWGILVITGFHLIAIGICCLQESWEDLIAEKKMLETSTDVAREMEGTFGKSANYSEGSQQDSSDEEVSC